MDTLVTGAAGFIGSHLVEALLDRGHDVRGLDDLSSGSRARLPDDEAFTFLEGSLESPAVAEAAVEGVDWIFHQAAVTSVQSSIDNPVETASVNCLGTTQLLEAAADAGVETAVVASSAAVYGDQSPPLVETAPVSPASPYALSKYWTEQLALQQRQFRALDTVALRYFNVYGPGQDPDGEYAAVIPKFASLLAAGDRPVIYGDGEQTRDFVYVDDVVEANLQAAQKDVNGGPFNIASGTETSINDLVVALNDVLGTDIEPQYDEPRPGDIERSVADVSRAREQLDFTAETDFRTGLERTVEWITS